MANKNNPSASYWAKRETEALQYYVTEEAEYDKQINKIYTNMLANCQKEINAFYGRYADKEGITIAEAKKRVSSMDIKAYEAKAKRYVKDKTFSKEANEEMRLYNATMRINRLEMLKANIGLELIAGSDDLEKFMAGILNGRTEDELKRQAGILGKTIKNNAELAHSIVNASFHNATFSQRIWNNNAAMKADLDKLIQNGLIQGKNPNVLAKDLQKYFIGEPRLKNGKKGAKYRAEVLMRTELARVQTEAQRQSFVHNGFSQYQFITNSGCCDICEGIKGKVFDVAKMMPGENAPPMHPLCRCSIAAHSDRKEYEAWLDYLEKGGTTKEWEAHGKSQWEKTLAKNGKSSTIELQANINKMITPYEKKVLDKVPPKEGYFDFAAHGTENNIEYESKDKVMSAREVARVIKHDKSYNGEKIRLLSCSTGATDEGFAQQLANALGVEVEAPSDVLIVSPDGTYQIGYDGKGEMRTFKPKRKE